MCIIVIAATRAMARMAMIEAEVGRIIDTTKKDDEVWAAMLERCLESLVYMPAPVPAADTVGMLPLPRRETL